MTRTKTVGTYWEVYHDEAPKTSSGLTKEDLVMVDTTLNYFVFPDDNEMITKKIYKKIGKYTKVQYNTVSKESPKLVEKTGQIVVSKTEFAMMEEKRKTKEAEKEKIKKIDEKEFLLNNPPVGVTYIRAKLKR